MDVPLLLVGIAMLALGVMYLVLGTRLNGRSRLSATADARRRMVQKVSGVLLVLVGIAQIVDAFA